MQRAHVVLVGMGEHEADDVAPLRDQIADVRQNEIDAGEVLLAGKGDAAIDNEPLAPALVTEAVEREIHSDLADAAERRENEFAARPSVDPPRRRRLAGRLVAEREYVAGGDRSQAAVGQAKRAAGRAHPVPRRARKIRRSGAAPAARRRSRSPRSSQSARIEVEAAAATPLREPLQHHAGQRREQAFGRDVGAGGGEIGGGIGSPAADDAGSSRRCRPQRPAFPRRSPLRSGCRRAWRRRRGCRSAISAPVFRAAPERNRAIASYMRQRGDERQVAGAWSGGAGSVEQKRGVEIAGQRGPGVAAPAAPRGLLPRRDPERAALAAARRASASALVEASVSCADRRTPAATAAG